MTTFADLSTLLLTFFVLLLSFATMDIKKFQDAMGSIQKALGFMPTGTGMFQHTMEPSFLEPPVATSVSPQSEEISQELKEMIKEHGLEKDVEVVMDKRGVVLRVKGRIFFNSGSDEIKKGALPILDKIADIMRKFPETVSIEGHTDNIPVNNDRFRSNWELSTARAISALRYLQKRGIDVKRIFVAGYADTRPIATNSTPEGRAKNRRVEFVFHSPEKDKNQTQREIIGINER